MNHHKKQPWRRFAPGTPIHHYQKTIDSGVIFYDEILMLEHFMLFSTYARQHNVTVLALNYILTHLHDLCKARSAQDYTKCMSLTTATFCRRLLVFWMHSQPLFNHGLEYAVKKTYKSIRSCLNYIANNAPEKKLCRHAIDYKWNFLKYAQSDHPFSEPYIASKASKGLKLARTIIASQRKADQVPSIDSLLTFRRKLNHTEWLQLVDYIIVQYNAIDYNQAASYFGSLENLITAPDFNLGEDHDIREQQDSNTYVPYYDLCKVVFNKNRIWNPFDKNLVDSNFRIIWLTRSADIKTIASFLHITEEKVEEKIALCSTSF